jgi:X-Pro dipeptidyl-peptidase
MNNVILSIGILFSIIISKNVFSQRDTTIAIPIIKDGHSQYIKLFDTPKEWIQEEVWVETEFDSDFDGKLDRMHVWVVRPYQTETQKLKLPVIYVTSPYFGGIAGGSNKYSWNIKHQLGELPKMHKTPKVKQESKKPWYLKYSYDKTWIPLGFIMVYSSSPGTGLSDGAPTMGGKNESLAPKAVIEWLTGKRTGFTSRLGIDSTNAYWSTGKVAMTGASFNGTMAIAAATTGVEGLVTIIPEAPLTSFYHYYRSNGLVKSPGGYPGEDLDCLFDMVYSGDNNKRQLIKEKIRDSILIKNFDRKTGDYNDFWKTRDYSLQMDSVKTSILMAHGFNDWNVMPEHSYRIYKKANELNLETMLYYHQNGHGGEPYFIMNKWLTHYLYGIENGLEKDPKVWITREHKSQYSTPTPYSSFPNEKSQEITFYFSKGNPKHGDFEVDKSDTNFITESFTDNYKVTFEKMFEKVDSSEHRLLYLTPILKEDLHLSGIPKVTITLSSKAEAANLSVALVSLPWEKVKSKYMYDNIVNRGWADPQNYKSISESEKLDATKFYTLTFEMMPDDQIIRKGQQLGFVIYSSDEEFTICPEPGNIISVDLNGTSLTLPIVDGIEAYNKATE